VAASLIARRNALQISLSVLQGRYAGANTVVKKEREQTQVREQLREKSLRMKSGSPKIALFTTWSRINITPR